MNLSRKLLEKQIAKATRGDGGIDLPRLAALVVAAYEDYERDRSRTNRSIGLMVEENDQLNVELKATVEALAVQNSRFQDALENMSHGLSMFDEDDRLVVANGRFRSMFGLELEHATTGASLVDMLGTAFARTVDAAKQRAKRCAARSAHKPVHREWHLPDGRIIEMAITPLRTGGWVALHNDVTEQRGAEAKIAFMARHDALTGLANRLMFREAMERCLIDLQPGQQLAILYLDLDHFKAVNDTLGHPTGDKLLRSAAKSLMACVDAADVVARLGGDEFAIIQAASPQPSSSTHLARRIIAALGHPFAIDGQQINVGTSIGIAVAPSDGTDADHLLKNADMALYRAKADGRSTFRYFERSMEAKLQARRALEVDLRGAIGNGELELLYQPIVTLADGSVGGFEALLRWNHPIWGRVPPAEFIPVAEETGLILAIGEWVLDRACTEAATWPAHVKVAVNVSPMQIKSKVLAFVVVGALARSGLSPTRLELEITEAVLLQDNDQTLATLHQLRNLGVRISMDDFGTGYSSLSYLRSFPFDKIKIDQSFVRDIGRKPDGLVIIRAIAGLGKSLGMLTTIEGVETEEQLDAVRREGFIEMQGFLASTPQPASEIPRLLGERLWAVDDDESLMSA